MKIAVTKAPKAKSIATSRKKMPKTTKLKMQKNATASFAVVFQIFQTAPPAGMPTANPVKPGKVSKKPSNEGFSVFSAQIRL